TCALPIFLSFRTGLVRLQLHPEDLRRMGAHFVDRAGELDAAALAAAAGVNLRLDDPDRAAERLRRAHRLVHRKARNAARHRDAVALQEFLGLVLVDLHGRSSVEAAESSVAGIRRSSVPRIRCSVRAPGGSMRAPPESVRPPGESMRALRMGSVSPLRGASRPRLRFVPTPSLGGPPPARSGPFKLNPAGAVRCTYRLSKLLALPRV